MTFYQWTLPKVQPDFQIYVKGNLHGMISGYENYQRSSFTVFSWWYAQSLFILDLRKIGGALVSGWIFPYSYTGLHNERWTEEGGDIQSRDAPITARIQYIMLIPNEKSTAFLRKLHIASEFCITYNAPMLCTVMVGEFPCLSDPKSYPRHIKPYWMGLGWQARQSNATLNILFWNECQWISYHLPPSFWHPRRRSHILPHVLVYPILPWWDDNLYPINHISSVELQEVDP